MNTPENTTTAPQGLLVDTPQGPVEVTLDTRLQYADANPKREGSKVHALWDTYSEARTVRELSELWGKGWKAALKFDAARGHVVILDDAEE